MIKIIDGDLIELAKQGQFNVVIHGANCQCVMGSGIAKQIKEQFPEAYEIDCKTKKGDILKLGSYTYSKAKNYDFIIINAYTQYNYGTDSIKVDYEALTLVLRKINFNFKGKTIGMPKIGAGLAGGDWNKIIKIIEFEMKDCNVTIVNYNKSGRW